jgi:CubicO group peptidase (beta-lactamase class C family)
MPMRPAVPARWPRRSTARRLWILCTLSLLLITPAHGDSMAQRAGFDRQRLARIDARMQEAVDDGLAVGAEALIARRGDTVYRQRWGVADREAGTALADDTLFRVYSMSKPITTVALLMLYEEGHFLLGDAVADYLPELAELQVITAREDGTTTRRPAARAMTIRDLMRHTAGLTYGLFGDSPADHAYLAADLFRQPTLRDFTRVLATLPLTQDPGTRWHYSVAVDVQGRLIEVLSGQSLGEFLQARIFAPLGMRDTGFRVSAAQRPRLAQLYSPAGSTLAWDARWRYGDKTRLEVADPRFSAGYFDGSTFESGGAGLVSTTSDYLRFAQMLAGEGEVDGVRLLAPGTVRLLRRDQLNGLDSSELWGADGFGLGVGIVRDVAGRSGELGADGAYGWGGAAGTNFWIDPEHDIVGLFMTQSVPHQAKLAARFRVLTYQALIE